MQRRSIRPAAAAVLLASLTACAATGAPASPETTQRPSPSLRPVATVPAETPAAATGEVPRDLMDEILADASERSGVEPSVMTVVRAEAVTWPDGSLGCPRPGMVYTQALVEGYHVVIGAGGEELDYRATDSGSFRLCGD